MRITPFIIILAFFFNACSGPQEKKSQTEENESPSVEENDGKVDLSSLELVDLQDNEIALKDMKGKVVVLNFWATWCKPCIMEMPSMDQAYQEMGDENFVFLAASYEEMEKIQRFQEKQQFSFPFIKLNNSLEALQIYTLPTTFIIDKEGNLADVIVGGREWNAPDMINQLKQL